MSPVRIYVWGLPLVIGGIKCPSFLFLRPFKRFQKRRPPPQLQITRADDEGRDDEEGMRYETEVLPEPSCLAEKVDEQEGDDTCRTGSRTADPDETGATPAGRRHVGHLRRSRSVAQRLTFAGHFVPAADGHADQIANAEAHIAGGQEDQWPFRISEKKGMTREIGDKE